MEPRISIIIPTLNEAKYLPLLLESIKKQTYKNWEIIVADAGSRDGTRKIAENAGAKVIEGGMPSKGRNNGAKVATGDYFLFLDSDVILPNTFLEKTIHEFDREYFDIAIPFCYPISKLSIDKTYFKVQRASMLHLGALYPFTHGYTILVTKRLFFRLGGFNEKIHLGEDNDFGNRAKKIAHFGIIASTFIRISVRRYNKEGRITLIQKYWVHGISLPLSKLGIKWNVDYEFGNFKNKPLSRVELFLEKVLKTLEKEL